MTDATEKRGAALPEAADRRNQETRLADKRKARSAPSRSERSQLASALLPLGSPVTPAEYELSPGGGRGRHHGPPPRTGTTRSCLAFPRAALVGAPVGVLPLARGRPASAPPPLLPVRPRPPARRGGHNQYRMFLGREGISTPGVVDVEVRLPVRNASSFPRLGWRHPPLPPPEARVLQGVPQDTAPGWGEAQRGGPGRLWGFEVRGTVCRLAFR